MTAVRVILGALFAFPVLLLFAFMLGPIALVPVLVIACCAPLLLFAVGLARYVDRS
jgi:hypothetical protein